MIFNLRIIDEAKGADTVRFAAESHPTAVTEFVFILDVPSHDDFPALMSEAVETSWPVRRHIYYGADRNLARCAGGEQRSWNEQDILLPHALPVSVLTSVEKWKVVRPRKNNAIEALGDFGTAPPAIGYHEATHSAAPMFKADARMPDFGAETVCDTYMPDAQVWPIRRYVLFFGESKLLLGDIGLAIHNLTLLTTDSGLGAGYVPLALRHGIRLKTYDDEHQSEENKQNVGSFEARDQSPRPLIKGLLLLYAIATPWLGFHLIGTGADDGPAPRVGWWLLYSVPLAVLFG